MATETTKVKILLRSADSDYTSLLLAGEAFYNKTSKKLYIGDGSSSISALPYFLNNKTGVTLDTYQEISGEKVFSGGVSFYGALYDFGGNEGIEGQILTSTEAGVKWKTPDTEELKERVGELEQFTNYAENNYATKTELNKKLDSTMFQDFAASVASTKQDTLVSGTNIKTINGSSILGSGNITIDSGGDLSDYYTKSEIDSRFDKVITTEWVEATEEFSLEPDENRNCWVYVEHIGDFTDAEEFMIGYFVGSCRIILKQGHYLMIEEVGGWDCVQVEGNIFAFSLPLALGGAVINPIRADEGSESAYFVMQEQVPVGNTVMMTDLRQVD